MFPLIDPNNITAVFLTHTHADHVAAIKLFNNATTYFSKQEEQMINGKKPVFLWIHNHIATKKYLLLNDNETIEIGNIKIKAILTPGHTPGSMCYVVNDKYLFTGDLVSLKEGHISKFNEFFNMDSKGSINSIRKITNLPCCEKIFTSHYGYCEDHSKAITDGMQE